MFSCNSAEIKNLRKEYIKASYIKRIIAFALCLVTLITVYLIIFPMLTFAHNLYCGYTEHTHTDKCYNTEIVLTCPLEENGLHTHNTSCYTTKKQLICTVSEHTHTQVCNVGENRIIGMNGENGDADNIGLNGEAFVINSFFILLVCAFPILLILYIRLSIINYLSKKQRYNHKTARRKLSLD